MTTAANFTDDEWLMRPPRPEEEERQGPNDPDQSRPVVRHVTRYGCPHCHRTRATEKAAARHIERCWRNPAARSCKTCKHHEYDYDEPDVGYRGSGDRCFAGFNPTPDPEMPNRMVLGCPGWERNQ